MTAEEDKVEALGDQWWNPREKLAALHRISPRGFEYFRSKCGPLDGRRVLDIGCGGGLLSERFARAGASVTGLDLSKSAIEAARRHAKAEGLDIDYRLAGIEDLAGERPGKFQIITCSEVLEHVDDLRAFLEEATGLLESGGFFFFSTLNKTMKARLLAVFAAENILRIVPRGAHDYNKFIRPSTLVEILEDLGVEVMELKGMSIKPPCLDFQLSDDLSMNYLGYGVKR